MSSLRRGETITARRSRGGRDESRDDWRGDQLENPDDPRWQEAGDGPWIRTDARGRVELPPPQTRRRDPRPAVHRRRDHGPLETGGPDRVSRSSRAFDLGPTEAPPAWHGPEQYGLFDDQNSESPIYGGTEWRDADFEQRAFHTSAPRIFDLYSDIDQRARGPHRGVGPRDYRRSAERIIEDICEILTDHPGVDASAIDVDVDGDGIVTLSGYVSSRREKRLAEDCCDMARGVRDVRNQIELDQ